jgi:hypothetical protein
MPYKITINLFLFFCIFGDVVSQLSQTYLPYFLNAKKNPPSESQSQSQSHSPGTPAEPEPEPTYNSIGNKAQVIQLVKRVTTLAFSIGVLNSLGCQALKLWGNRLFTNSEVSVICHMSYVSQ